ncbi:MAG: DUF433 domain-containing protein [Gemmataceae bacterium]
MAAEPMGRVLTEVTIENLRRSLTGRHRPGRLSVWTARISSRSNQASSGQPCIRGMRITVRDVLEYLAGGMTVEELLADFPELTAEDAPCLAYAATQLPSPAV